jgi:hypothetical protein
LRYARKFGKRRSAQSALFAPDAQRMFPGEFALDQRDREAIAGDHIPSARGDVVVEALQDQRILSVLQPIEQGLNRRG